MKESSKPQLPSKEHQKNESQDRPKWHKPTLQQLRLSLDTAADTGSIIDGGAFTTLT